MAKKIGFNYKRRHKCINCYSSESLVSKMDEITDNGGTIINAFSDNGIFKIIYYIIEETKEQTPVNVTMNQLSQHISRLSKEERDKLNKLIDSIII